MSASSEKRRRQSEREQGLDKRQQARREAEEQARKSQRNWTVGGVLIAVLVVVILLLNSSLMYKLPAVTISDKTFSAAEVNYFYYNNYGPYLGTEYVTEAMTRYQALYEEAQNAGYTISEEGQAQIDENIESLHTAAEENKVSVKRLLTSNFGKGMTESIYRDLMTRMTIAGEYAQQVQDSFEYTDAELTAYFDEHQADYQTYRYMFYQIAAETETTMDEAGQQVSVAIPESLEATAADAKAIAEQVTDEASFYEAVAAYQEGAAPTTANPTVAGSIPADYVEWVTDPARKAGDVTDIKGETASYVVMYLGTNDQHYPETANMRHILIKSVDVDGDGSYSAEEQEAAKARIEEIEAEWKAGPHTEEAFAALAEQYSEDEGSKSNGGLYENVVPKQMVTEFNEFCFTPGRKTGDTGIVQHTATSAQDYDGYHLIYFVSADGEDYSLTLAENTMRENAYREWETGILESYTQTTKLGMKFVGVM